jgi:FkbM family methyltransferase
MKAVRHAKDVVKEAFPSIWLKWHFMRRPKTAEVELRLLKKLVPANSVTVDVGANCGLYTRELARLSKRVHAFEPSRQMADLLRRTVATNVKVHEVALSDHHGVATLTTPTSDQGVVHGLASIEEPPEMESTSCIQQLVETARLDKAIKEDVAFVKIDVEGHELQVLSGAEELINRSRPVFLVEAEDRHRQSATRSVFDFFAARGYHGFFLRGGEVLPVSEFDSPTMQDPGALLSSGGRKEGRFYVNNFFFFPLRMNGQAVLLN